MKSRPGLTAGAWLRQDAIWRAIDRAQPTSVLEVGPGLGAMAARLSSRFDYTAIELDDESYRATAGVLAGGPGGVHHGSFETLPTESTFDLVCAFEVLEHIEGDAEALVEWVGRLSPGGHVLISVPSGPERMGPSDRLAGHFRRYTRDMISERFEEAGLDLVSAEEWGAGLGHVLEHMRNWLASRGSDGRSVEERTGASGRWLQPKGNALALVNAVVAAPFRVVQMPFRSTDIGIGLVALGRRRA